MAKHLIDLDEDALAGARRRLGTSTMKDTVNAALRQAADIGAERLGAALDVLATTDLADRSETWR